jgi:hypothetical protein
MAGFFHFRVEDASPRYPATNKHKDGRSGIVSEIYYFVVNPADYCSAQSADSKTVTKPDDTSQKRDPISDEELTQELQMGANHIFPTGINMSTFDQKPVSCDEDCGTQKKAQNQP